MHFTLFLLMMFLIGCETIDGKVTKCQESIESVDAANKRISYKLFGGDFGNKYKVFKLIFEAIDKESGAIIKWTIEYERIGKEVDPPYGYIEYLHTGSGEIDGHLKA